jgi:uncharacterized protein YuzE
MKLTYDAATDSLYLALRKGAGTDSDEIAPNVVADFDAEGCLTGLDIQHASVTIDLGDFHVEGLTGIARRHIA